MMTISHLNQDVNIRLSPLELRAISQQIHQDFAPTLALPPLQAASTVRLSPQELRNISDEISREFAPKPGEDEAELLLLPVDPEHIYAYWKLTDAQTTALSNNTADEPFTLRIYAQAHEAHTTTLPEHWFDVMLPTVSSQQAVRLPEAIANTTTPLHYSAIIGKRDTEDHLIPFAQSNSLPHTYAWPPANGQDARQTPTSSASRYLPNKQQTGPEMLIASL
jgi:hypothetical protein